jgi:hypothetical protein
MKTSQQYLANARAQMRGSFNNASGGTSAGYRNMTGSQLANAPGRTGQRPQGWAASGGASAMPASAQYIFQISNASAAAVSNFDLLGAGQYLSGGYGGGTWSAGGNFTLNGVTITCVFGTISYQSALAAFNTQPFVAGGVYLESVTGSTQQVSDVYTLTTQDPGGELYSKPIKPFKDPYQFQNGITYNNSSFVINTLTKLTFGTIYASAVFQITLFPAQVIDPTQALNNTGSVNTYYGKPRVIGNLQ